MGYDLALFVKKVTEDTWMCPICLDVLKDPYTLKCAHVFCRECLDVTCSSYPSTCPVCRERVSSEKDKTFVRSLWLQISKLKIRCPYWVTKKDEEAGSATSARRGIASASKKRPVVYDLAEDDDTDHSVNADSGSARSRGKRRKECDDDQKPAAMVSGKGCSWVGRVDEVRVHSKRDCAFRIEKCPIDGCSYKGGVMALLQHKKEFVHAHVEMLSDELAEMKDRLTALESNDDLPPLERHVPLERVD